MYNLGVLDTIMIIYPICRIVESVEKQSPSINKSKPGSCPVLPTLCVGPAPSIVYQYISATNVRLHVVMLCCSPQHRTQNMTPRLTLFSTKWRGKFLQQLLQFLRVLCPKSTIKHCQMCTENNHNSRVFR